MLPDTHCLYDFDHEETVVELGLRELRVSLAGEGRPLLMINGLGASLEVMTPLRRCLPDFRTICFDPPGVGQSPLPTFPLRIRQHAKVAIELLDHLGIDQVDLFGVSWGGALAQEIAYRYPERVGKIILCSTMAGPGFLTTPSVYRAFFDFRKRSSKVYLREVAPALFGGPVRHNARELYDTGVLHKLADKKSLSFAYQMAAAIGWTSLPYLWSIKNETLILTGDDDPLIRPYNAKLLAMAIRNSQLKVVKGEGHFLFVSSAKKTAALIREFI